MKILTCEQLSPQWFAARRNIPTGSALANIVTPKGAATKSAARETYKHQLLYQRITGATIEHSPNKAMERGNELEPEARKWFEMEHNVDVKQVGFCLHDGGFCGVSPDGFVGDNEGLEIKTAMEAPYISKLIKNEVPACNMVQIQACLWVTGFDRWNFLLYDPKLPNFEAVVRRDEAVISALKKYVPVFVAELDAEEAALRQRYGLPERKKLDLNNLSDDWCPWK